MAQQSLIYFMQYAKDKAYIKILVRRTTFLQEADVHSAHQVAVTLICEVVHQGIISFTRMSISMILPGGS